MIWLGEMFLAYLTNFTKLMYLTNLTSLTNYININSDHFKLFNGMG
jgi:hypothetical protein